jgi:hypothetical protein
MPPSRSLPEVGFCGTVVSLLSSLCDQIAWGESIWREKTTYTWYVHPYGRAWPCQWPLNSLWLRFHDFSLCLDPHVREYMFRRYLLLLIIFRPRKVSLFDCSSTFFIVRILVEQIE